MSKVHCFDLFQGLEARPGFDLTGWVSKRVISVQSLIEPACSPDADLEQRPFEDVLMGLNWVSVPIVES
jgi:hypothetical protein